jgi:hypothetical protein
VTAKPRGEALADGWFFRRGMDGSVTIWSGIGQEEVTVSAKTWARIVASVTAGGESPASHQAALTLHQGG